MAFSLRKIAGNETIQKIIQRNTVGLYFKNICKRLFFKCANGRNWEMSEMFFENWDYILTFPMF